MRSSALASVKVSALFPSRLAPCSGEIVAPAPAIGKRVSFYSSTSKSQVLGLTLFGLN